jgi:hypothetical protein
MLSVVFDVNEPQTKRGENRNKKIKITCTKYLQQTINQRTCTNLSSVCCRPLPFRLKSILCAVKSINQRTMYGFILCLCLSQVIVLFVRTISMFVTSYCFICSNYFYCEVLKLRFNKLENFSVYCHPMQVNRLTTLEHFSLD